MNCLYKKILEGCPEIVHWAFEKKPENFKKIIEEFKTGNNYSNIIKFLKILKLAEELKKAKCPNLQDKFAETSDWGKFLSLGSELFFAYEFVKLGFCVSLILDNSIEWKTNGNNIPSPDFTIKKCGKEYLVEVARIKGDGTISEISNKIKPIIEQYPFCISIHYSEKFSSPAVSYDQRKDREKLVKDFVRQFERIIPQINNSSLPKNEYILDCEIKFAASCSQSGSQKLTTSGGTDLHKKINSEIKNQLEKKAEKRKKWNNSQRKLPYLVALDVNQYWFSEDRLVPFLFGKKFDYGCKTQYSELPIVTQAKHNGWMEFLENVGFKANSISYIPKPGDIPDLPPGILICNKTIQKNLTGIIIKSTQSLQFVSNPFADKEINDIQLQNCLPWKPVLHPG